MICLDRLPLPAHFKSRRAQLVPGARGSIHGLVPSFPRRIKSAEAGRGGSAFLASCNKTRPKHSGVVLSRSTRAGRECRFLPLTTLF